MGGPPRDGERDGGRGRRANRKYAAAPAAARRRKIPALLRKFAATLQEGTPRLRYRGSGAYRKSAAARNAGESHGTDGESRPPRWSPATTAAYTRSGPDGTGRRPGGGGDAGVVRR